MAAAAMLASTPPQPLPKPQASLPLASTHSHRLPTPHRRARDGPPKTLHSSPPADWSMEQRIQESLAVLDLMEAEAITPEPALFCTLLKSCADAGTPRFGRIVHDKVLRSGLQADPFVANSLMLMYSKCGLIGTARQLFDEIPVKNVVSWTTAISMYHHAGFPHDALDLYRSMKKDPGVRPNAFTYTIALNSCASVGALEMGTEIHDEIVIEGFDDDEFVVVALIDMYAKCGRVSEARKVLDGITKPSVEACTAMIEGYNANGDGKEAMGLVRRTLQLLGAEATSRLGFVTIIRPCLMELALRQGQEIHAHIIKFEHKPGMKTLSALADLYEKCDMVMDALRVFDELVVKDVGLCGRMISGLVRNGLYVEALKVYVDMTISDNGLYPFAVCSVLEACVGLLGLEEGRQIHGKVIKVRNLVSRDSVIGGLAELYRSCGEDEAYNLMKQ